jgi:hypothetical protein
MTERGSVVIFDEAVDVLGAAILQWAGVPLTSDAERGRRARQLAAMVDGFATPGRPYIDAVRARIATDRWARGLIRGVRDGSLDFFVDWNRAAKECVAALRLQAGREPSDRDLSGLVGELCTQSTEFAALWATHNVRLHRKMEKQFSHPVVGELTLQYERLTVAGDPGLEIFAYVAEPGSRSAESFTLLATWATDATMASSTPSDQAGSITV